MSIIAFDFQVLKDHKGTINALVVDPEGKTLFSGGGDGLICCWNIATGELVRKMTGHESAVMGLIVSYTRKIFVYRLVRKYLSNFKFQ